MTITPKPLEPVAVDGHEVVVTSEIVGEELRLEVSVDGGAIGRVTALRYYTPQRLVDGTDVAIWAGERFFVVHVADQRVDEYEWDDEIGAVYAVGGMWCVRGETTVVLLDRLRGEIVSRFVHNEVLTESWWLEDRLMLRDFAGKVIALEVNRELHQVG